MPHVKYPCLLFIWCTVALFVTDRQATAQPEVQAWGNVKGIRVDGQLMEFETSLRVVGPDWSDLNATGKERQRPTYARRMDEQVVSTRIDSLFFEEIVEDLGDGRALVTVEVTSRADTNIAGAFFSITLPAAEYSGGSVQIIDPSDISLARPAPNGRDEILRVVARGARFVSARSRLEIIADEATDVIVKRERNGDAQAYFAVASGPMQEGQVGRRAFILSAAGEIDRRPIELVLDTSEPGRQFDGLGGNFRLQNPRTDPPVIDYNLENLRVAYARFDMPWMLWHREESVDPLEAAEAGNLHPRVAATMEMAQRLRQMDIPVIGAIWFAPDWAIVGERRSGRGPDGLFGNALRDDKMEQIFASITSYLVYLKKHYGVDVEWFSFNESDLGIDVRQTAEEHRQLIKGLGAYFASKGLQTKLLLGDTADVRGYDFIMPALNDPETHPYIGAVSFHSWRGWEDENLRAWDAAAERLGVPLIVGEGSIDAGAWRYPAIFEEPTYAMEEINLYTRILAICEPLTILQWQLTADYSILAGGGVFGNDEEPLRPTQRFWNLKQLASTPKGLYAMSITSNRSDVTAAALGDNEHGVYAVHLVNNGTSREVTLMGIPENVTSFRVYVTDRAREMNEEERVAIRDGAATFTMDTTSYMTLITE